MYIGDIRHNINVAEEYELLARGDENVAILLKQKQEYRHSIYFFIQAMEKYIRSKIFTMVNPNIEYFRKRNQTHSIEQAIEFLIEIVSSDDNVREQIKKQLEYYVLKGINFRQLHNNLRYPFYSLNYNSYSNIDYSKKDCEIIEKSIYDLRKYLDQLNRF